MIIQNRKVCAFAVVVVLCLISETMVSDAAKVGGRIKGSGNIGPTAVWIEGLPGVAVPAGNTTIKHVDGKFDPYLSIGFVGNEFIFRNEDETLHNTHLYLRLGYQKTVPQRPLHYGATLYNVAQPKSGKEVKRPIKPYHRYRDDTGFIEIVCNPHPEEIAYMLVFDHPFAVMAQHDGSFTIPNVPAGRHEIRFWNNRTVTSWGFAEVKDEGVTDLLIELE